MDEALSLFRPEVFEHLEFHNIHALGMTQLATWLDEIGYPSARLLPRWQASGCFMHGINHPKRLVTEDLAVEMLRKIGLTPDDYAMRHLGIDRLAYSTVWSVYPAISERLGLGEGRFAYRNAISAPKHAGRVYDLEGFIAESYRLYHETPPELLRHERLSRPQYETLPEFLPRAARRGGTGGAHPYRSLPPHQFWKTAMARVERAAVDPVVAPKFTLSRESRIATAGSCFAQHIARTLVASGFTYFVTEKPPAGLAATEAEARQYGLFSARFGNIYTPRQLLQLFDRAFGTFTPEAGAWQGRGGAWIDPFRPGVEPGGFASLAALEADRQAHLAAVREMFAQLDTFIFTLGLTEGWRDRSDGAVFPLAPGVAGGEMDPARYEFVNFALQEVVADLRGLWQRLRGVNPTARMILTVSPVPLAATYEPRHVLQSTVASKAILRVAAEELSRAEADIAYFPSYEIITGPHAGNSYYEEDLRSVRPEGVQHVMGLFIRHYLGGGILVSSLEAPEEQGDATAASKAEAASAFAREAAGTLGVICDEERLQP